MGSGALVSLVPLLSAWGLPVGGPDRAGGSGLGVWASAGLNGPGWPVDLGASRPRLRSERSRGLSGAQSWVAVTSVLRGLLGPVGSGCPLPGRCAGASVAPGSSLSGTSESQPAGGERGVSPGVGGVLSLALAARRARSC